MVKSSPNVWYTFAISEKLSKENSHTMGEKSPNLVTLLGTNM
jgi:hypothetical protein